LYPSYFSTVEPYNWKSKDVGERYVHDPTRYGPVPLTLMLLHSAPQHFGIKCPSEMGNVAGPAFRLEGSRGPLQ
jgi:hypothetical protein